MKPFQRSARTLASVALMSAMIAAQPASAAKRSPAAAELWYGFEDPISKESPATIAFNKAKADELLSKYKSGRRLASAVEPQASDFKPDYNEFLNEILAIKVKNEVSDRGADQLEALIARYSAEEKYATLSPETKLIVAQLAAMAPMRGIVYRLRHLFEEKSNNVHSLVVTQIRALATALRIYLPTDQWSAGFEFVVKPSSEDSRATQFGSVFALQTYLISKKVMDPINTAIERLVKLRDEVGAGKIFIDNRIAFGSEPFLDKLDQYRVVDAAELNLLIAGFHMAKAQIFMFGAYDQDDAFKAGEELGKITGLNKINPMTEFGVTSEARVTSIYGKKGARKLPNYLKLWTTDHLKAKYPKFVERNGFFREKQSLGHELMARAYNSLKEAVNFAEQGSKLARLREPNRFEVVKTLEVRASEREADLVFANVRAMLDGNSVTSSVTRKPVQVRLDEFFHSPPRDLKDFLPIAWEGEGKGIIKRATEKVTGWGDATVMTQQGKILHYRNYFTGRPTQWDTAAWGQYVSTVDKDGKRVVDVPEIVRSLRFTTGGAFATPMAFFVR